MHECIDTLGALKMEEVAPLHRQLVVVGPLALVVQVSRVERTGLPHEKVFCILDAGRWRNIQS